MPETALYHIGLSVLIGLGGCWRIGQTVEFDQLRWNRWCYGMFASAVTIAVIWPLMLGELIGDAIAGAEDG